MKIFDLSIPIRNTMAVWPGDHKVSVELGSSIQAGDEANVSHIKMSAHTGTHIDAPFHFINHGISIDQLDLNLLVGECEVIKIENEEKMITDATLAKLGKLDWPKRVLFKTNNSNRKLLKSSDFYEDFVSLSVDAAEFLIKQGVKLIGIDYLSIASYENGDKTHVALLEKEIVVIEGLNLTKIDPGIYQLVALPLLLQGSDGAPARVVLLQNEETISGQLT